MRNFATIAVLALCAGCSTTSLRCGMDGESSYVDLENARSDITSQVSGYVRLCGFAVDNRETQRETP